MEKRGEEGNEKRGERGENEWQYALVQTHLLTVEF